MGIEVISAVFGLVMGVASAWGSSVIMAVKMNNAFNSRLEAMEDRFDKQFEVLHTELVKQAQFSAVHKTSVESRFELIELKIATLQERFKQL